MREQAPECAGNEPPHAWYSARAKLIHDRGERVHPIRRDSGRPRIRNDHPCARGVVQRVGADTNIAIGTAYLRKVLDRYGGKPYFAIAGYNAGPTPLQRWQAQRPGMDPDFWIETISYKETRDYVARVLAFSVIYDWRLNGDAAPVSERMRGIKGGKRKPFVCPTPGEAGTTAGPAK